MTEACERSVTDFIFAKGRCMRYFPALTLIAALTIGSAAFAGEAAVHVLPAASSAKPVPVQAVSSQTVYSAAPRPKQTFFGKVMDLERRKNAWLRRTFLGR
jgi:hypothetical protein